MINFKKIPAWKVAMLLSVATGIAAFNLWPFFHGWGFYSKMSALSYLFVSISMALKIKRSRLCLSLVVLAANRWLDELFFDPLAVSINEYITVGIVILIILFGINFHSFKR